MKVSVVVTVYNLARYVEATLASVFAQSHHDVEIIVVDDASTDGSVELLRAHEDRITLVRHDRNRGVLAATLSGLEKATGEIVAFLDGDDLWEPEKLARVATRFAADDRTVMVSHDCSVIDGSGKKVRGIDPTQAPTRARAADADALSAGMRRSVLEYRGEVWLGSAWCLRNAALDRAEVARWVSSLPDPTLVYQDHPLATLLLLTNPDGRVDYVNEALLRYRIHDANYSGAARDLVRAKKIVDKGWATRKATLELVRHHTAHDTALVIRQDWTLCEYDYLRALYERDLLGAAIAFADCVRGVWPLRQVAKEAARFGAVGLLGPERFLALRARQR